MATGGFVQFTAIVPRSVRLPKPENVTKAVQRAQTGAHAIQAEAARYPPQKPTVSGYVRTGTLGRGWNVLRRPDGAIVQNPVLYAAYVQGDWQTNEMASREWKRVEEIGERIWNQTILPEIRALLEATD